MGVFLSGPHLGPIHSNVRLSGGKKKNSSSGGVLGIIVLAVLLIAAIHYWFIAVPVLVVALAVGIPVRRKAVRTQQEAQAMAARDARAAARDADELRVMHQSVEVARLRNEQAKLDREFYKEDPTP
jgi:hypothetical protein